jgi:hypothetical protein
MILGSSFNKVLHSDLLLPIDMKIIHGRQAKTIRQFVMILPSVLINHKIFISFTLGVIWCANVPMCLQELFFFG